MSPRAVPAQLVPLEEVAARLAPSPRLSRTDCPPR
jgi:hypothetical protein